MPHHDYLPSDMGATQRRTDNAGCMALGCVVAMGGVLGFLLLAVWIVLPAIAERLS